MNSGKHFDTALVGAHREWSDTTFGDRTIKGPIGPLKHLKLEVDEAIENPSDISEFADMQFLIIDALHRAGHSFDDLNTAMWQKLKILKGRDYKTNQTDNPDEAVQHA